MLILAALPIVLAGCNQAADADMGTDEGPREIVATTANEPAIVELPAAFLSKDCATVAGAYAKTLGAKQYTVAAQAWADAVGSDRLAMGYQNYGTPNLQIGETRQEGAAGSLFCEVTVTLRDGDNPQSPLKQGTITFRRANDVPGATTDQLRWRITKSTIDEGITGAAVPPPG